MAQVIWTEPALNELDAIATLRWTIRKRRVGWSRIFQQQLADHPKSGSEPPELKGWRYRQIVEPPCRVFYREDGEYVYILYVMRENFTERRT